ncbi:MAG TPA: phosphatidylglycerophosphatase A [Phycisphaerales bacterium]|nr:phosphatidylglycerophosphatase A [Phycisphaerales bacterium]
MTYALSPLGRRLVTTFGLGFRRPASGTWGSLPPVILAAILLALGLPAESLAFGLILIVVSGVFLGACLRFGDPAAAEFGRDDPSQVVADETGAMALVLAFLPAGSTASPLLAALTLALAFLAFRVFDILKPFPAAQLQNLPGAWGVLLDDVAAAIYALIALHLAATVL